ncbi:serine/threonine-protein kinase [Streptomyces sp. NPDC102406]|uniref:serine/threonine-protein kinase n=1 Tax=Streptomyces sp. NPDC102406 TaxID=3366171 RepID=UPI003811F2EE
MRGRLLSGRYRLMATIGSGGMGQVWRAHDEELGRLVALKLFAPPDDIAAGERHELLRRFRREARAVAALSSPHVVTVHDHGTDETTGTSSPYLVMELIDGESLRQVLRRDVRVPVDRALEWARQTLRGLAVAHAAGIVHRDIKPANIMVTPPRADAPHGTVKILDFGIAAFLEGAEAATRLTRTGTLPIGSVLYMAPERFRQEPGDGRIDLYALGCVLYELLVGRPPFNGPPAGVMYNHLHDTPLRPGRARPEVPSDVDELIAALMAKRPEDRPRDAPTALATLTTLTALTSGGSAQPATVPDPAPDPDPSPPPSPAPPASRPRRRRGLLVGAVALACVGAGVAVPAAMDGEGAAPRPGITGAATGPPPVFRIAVVSRGARVDTRAAERALGAYAGPSPLRIVAVPHADRLTVRELVARHPGVVAAVGDPGGLRGPYRDIAFVQTCQDPPGSRARRGKGFVGLGQPDDRFGEQFGTYLERTLHTRRLLAMGVATSGPDGSVRRPGAPHRRALAARFAAARGAGFAYTAHDHRPTALAPAALETLLRRARPDTVYLEDSRTPGRDVGRLRQAGFGGRVVLAPDRLRDCSLAAGDRAEDSVPTGVHRFRTVSDSPYRHADCAQDAALCSRVGPLMTRPGALEEFEAVQAVVAAFRARAARDTSADAARAHVLEGVPDARVHGLQGDYTVRRLDTDAVRPVWVERRTAGAWKVLGTVASLTRD